MASLLFILIQSSLTKAQNHPYLYHDHLHTVSDWQTKGDVGIVSSSNCPSSATTSLSPFKISNEDKICVSNSNNQLFDGEYLFESYNPTLNASIYHHTNTNKYFSAYYTPDNYEYYIHSFHSDNITTAKCMIPVTTLSIIFDANDIELCIGKWQFYHDNDWYLDSNLITVPCQDQCVEYNDKEWIDGGIFKYHSFNITRGTNIYYCSECDIAPYNGVYLYGWIYQDGDFNWRMGPDPNSPLAWSDCSVANNLPNGYIFNLQDCTAWYTYNSTTETWNKDQTTTHLCQEDDVRLLEFNALTIPQESKVCINGADNSDINGEYLWLFYDSYVNGSVYYNIKSQRFLYPFIGKSGNYYWHIHIDSSNAATNIRCKMNINECAHNWEVYRNGKWIDSDMYMTECQDLCVKDHDKSFIPDGASFSYVYFNATLKTNIYFCDECTPTSYDGVYLYGHIYDTPSYYWLIGSDPNSGLAWSGYQVNFANNVDYMFNVDEFIYERVDGWTTYDGSEWKPDHMIWSTCNAETSQEMCMEITDNGELMKEYVLNGSYTGFAIGFDVNTISLEDDDVFVVEYSCDGNEDTSNELTVFGYTDQTDIPINNIIYQLPTDLCDNQNSITTIFSIDSAFNTTIVYIDNVYLYYDVTNTIFIDEMISTSNWDISSSDNAEAITDTSSEYCPSDGRCINLITSDKQQFVHITTTIDLRNEGYKYKDLNIKWSAITASLYDGSTFNVELQCDNNYLYTNDLCLLKQYDTNNNCIDTSCNIQTYNLPSECDFASIVIIKFTLQSSTSAASVFIDYIQLTHSDASGLNTPECRYQTSLPTTFPTSNPTAYPSTNPTVYTSTNPTAYPSPNPSAFPSINPIVYTSQNPSAYPSQNPVTSSPTSPLSSLPSLSTISITLPAIDTTLFAKYKETKRKTQVIPMWLIIVICIVTAIVVILLVLLCIRYKNQSIMNQDIKNKKFHIPQSSAAYHATRNDATPSTDDAEVAAAREEDEQKGMIELHDVVQQNAPPTGAVDGNDNVSVANLVPGALPASPRSLGRDTTDPGPDLVDTAGSKTFQEGEREGMNDEEHYSELKEWFLNIVEINKGDRARYCQLFIDEGYETLKSLELMDENTMKEMGIFKGGHRKLIMRAIKNSIASGYLPKQTAYM